MGDKANAIMGVFAVGLLIGLFSAGIFIRSCDKIPPYLDDATQIHLVETGHGQWIVNPDGSTEFSLDSIIKYPEAVEEE